MRTNLIYNPTAGRGRGKRMLQIEEVCAILRAHGHEVTTIATFAPGSAAGQVRAAIAGGAQCLFACGGDGTVHDVLQGMVEGAGSCVDETARPILGILPMGSANALARHLGLSMDPVEAARQQMDFVPRLIPVGKVECGGNSRCFLVMAGAGADGMLMYEALRGSKSRLGRLAYYLRAFTLFATRRFPAFNLEFIAAGTKERCTLRAVNAMAVRIDDLGGLFRRVASGGEIDHPHLRLFVVRPPAWLSLPAWFVMGWLGLENRNPLLQIVDVDDFTCTSAEADQLHIQADGEWIGTAPMHAALMPEAVRVLMR